MNAYFKIFFLIILFYTISFNVHSMDSNIDESNINHAKAIASNILNRENQLENGITNIMNDHSKSTHSSGDSYFTTDDRDKMILLVKAVVSTPDKFKFYHKGPNYRLAISKKILETDAQAIFSQNNIGYDEKFSTERFRVVLCFGINEMKKLSDSQTKGGFLTGFPAREDYVLGR